MKYYLVTAKCGHVGRGKYHEVEFPICAESKSDAVQICLKKPKVKKQLKDAVSMVVEISLNDYLLRKEQLKDDVYVRAHTKREISDYVQSALRLTNKKSHHSNSFETREERVKYIMKKQKIKEQFLYA